MRECVIHSKEHDFDIPESLYQSIIKSKTVIFAGSGISTESHLFPHYRFFYTIADILQIDPFLTDLSFSSLMSSFVQKYNRKELIIEIKKRIDYIKSFDKLYNFATRFHRELSTIPYFHDIITTNWDDFFERECSAIPIVVDEDMIFWDIPERRVLKIHGSINNIGTIIATDEDYKKKYVNFNNSTTGGLLKQIIATKKVIFAGYSFSDSDFINMYNRILENMNDLIDDHYIITLDNNIQAKVLHKKAKIINTDATYFLKKIKEKMINDRLMINDETYEILKVLSIALDFDHIKTSELFIETKNPNLVYSMAYQDGYLDAIKRMIKHKNTGQYSAIGYIKGIVQTYNEFLKEPCFKEAYGHLANLHGYKNFLDDLYKYIMTGSCLLPNFYFLFGYKDNIDSIDDLKKVIMAKETYHQRSYNKAKKDVDTLGQDIVMDFMPIL